MMCVAVGDDQDVFKAVPAADHVGDSVEPEGPGAVELLTTGVGGQVGRAGAGRGRVAGGWSGRTGSGLGRGGSALAVASHAVRGVTRPGRPWWGRSVL